MLVRKNGGAVLDTSKISIGKMPIGTFTGSFELTHTERSRVIGTCKKIWAHLRAECRGADPVGLHRFDLVPAFARSQGAQDDLGELYIKGVYEVNGHSPECLAAASMIRHFYPNIPCENAAKAVVTKIQETYGDVEVAFVVGLGSALKAHWYKFLVEDLRAAGLRLTIMAPEEVMEKRPLYIWRWGDVRAEGENDYASSNDFTSWLYTQDECTVFNRVLSPGEDVTNKSLLLSSRDPDVAMLLGNNRNLNGNTLRWSVDEYEYQALMAKPDGGSSGKGLVFGEHYSERRWMQKLREIIESGLSYSLWQTQWLPAISVGTERLAIDFNPAFWVDGDEITYLYTIIRIDQYENYRTVRKINVSRGGGIAGLIY